MQRIFNSQRDARIRRARLTLSDFVLGTSVSLELLIEIHYLLLSKELASPVIYSGNLFKSWTRAPLKPHGDPECKELTLGQVISERNRTQPKGRPVSEQDASSSEVIDPTTKLWSQKIALTFNSHNKRSGSEKRRHMRIDFQRRTEKAGKDIKKT